MKCPKCGHENKDDVLFCRLCYTVLKKETLPNTQLNTEESLENNSDKDEDDFTKKFKVTWKYYHLFFAIFMIVAIIIGRRSGPYSFWSYLATQPLEAFFLIISLLVWMGYVYYMSTILMCPKCGFQLFTVCIQKIRFWRLIKTNNCPNCKTKLLKMDNAWRILKWIPPF